VVEQRVAADQRVVVAGGQDDDIVAAGLGGVPAQLDGLARRLGARADDDGHGREAGRVQGAAGRGGDALALVAVQVDGLAGAALDDEACDPGAREEGGVLLDGGEVDLLVGAGEEGGGRDVDAGFQRTGHLVW